ncbi:MAG: sugar phosphate isomerase/epimerase family protein [Infirmifilum sp.]
MKLAVTTIPWGKIKRIAQFREVLRLIHEVGFDGVGLETRLLPKEILKNPNILPKILNEIGLENAGAYSRLSFEELEWAEKSETRLFWVVPRGRDCNKIYQNLVEFIDVAQKKNIVVAVHNHLRTCFETESQVRELVAKVPNVSLCLDTAHAVAAGFNIIEFIRHYHNRIALVHLKDLRAKLPKYQVRFKRDFVNIGKGIINFEEILKELSKNNYNKYIMLEIEALSERPEDEIKQGYFFIIDLFKKIA